jgi:hypothetical protein
MNHKHEHVFTFFCLACTFFPYFSTFLQSSLTIKSENLIVLKYEVNDVFVGNLKHVIQINNPTNSKVEDGKLFVPIIKNETARHYVILYNISSPIGQPTISSDDSGNTYAFWSDITIDRKQAFTVEINYHVLSFDIHYLINSSIIADYDVSSDLYRKYTQSEELIESNDLEIVLAAQSLTSSENNVHEKVLEIYNFVITHLRYEAQDEERGAFWALESKVGDCSEYSYLFVALCRAAGIPARVQAGFAFRSVQETLKDGHMWAEYYLENYGWIPVDATWRLFDAMDYSHFGSLQSMPEVIPYANYVFNNTIGPEPEDEQTVQLARSSSTAFSNDSFAENTIKTAQKIMQSEFAILIGRFLGTPLIFPSETEKTTQTLLESQIYLQNIIDSWENSPHIAQPNIASALESAEKASQDAWMLVVKALAIFISIPTVIMLIASIYMKRHQTKHESLQHKPYRVTNCKY